MSGIADKILTIDAALDAAVIPHAFGGALALAWCTQRARGTIDIDVNIFVDPSRAGDVLAVLPRGIHWAQEDLDGLAADGQVRLWWGTTPVDVFLNTTQFHAQAAKRSRQEPFAGGDVPFLSCSDLAVFKAFFNRTQDWADLGQMAEAETLDLDRVIGVLVRYLGPDDERINRLGSLGSPG